MILKATTHEAAPNTVIIEVKIMTFLYFPISDRGTLNLKPKSEKIPRLKIATINAPKNQ